MLYRVGVLGRGSSLKASNMKTGSQMGARLCMEGLRLMPGRASL